MVNNFLVGCRFVRPPFVLLMEQPKMKFMLLIYDNEQAWGAQGGMKTT
jgi:hypothetical protein